MMGGLLWCSAKRARLVSPMICTAHAVNMHVLETDKDTP